MTTAPRTGDDAVAWARSRIGDGAMPDSGLCLQFTRQCFEVPSLYYSALDAGLATNVPHPGDRNPPGAVPVWFRTPSVYDHVCFYVGPHEVISTFNDDVRAFDGLDGIEANFDGTYVGWAEDINEMTVYVDAPAPTPVGEDDGMRVIYDPETHSYALIGAGYAYVIPNQEQADVAQRVYGAAVNVGTRYAWDLAYNMALVGTVAAPNR